MSGLLFGFVLFTVDLLLLVGAFRWLWGNRRKPSQAKTIVLLLVAKLVILGGGVYCALVIYLVEPLSFVGGSLLALLVFSIVFYCRGR